MKKPNVSIIVLDTMRLDAFKNSLKGNPGLLGGMDYIELDRCIAPSSWTLPSHASIFTGMYPSRHGAHETRTVKSLDIGRIKLRKSTIVGDLKGMGYETYGISANPYVHPVYGFTGFDWFKEESYFTDMSGSVIEVAAHLKPLVSRYRNEYGNDKLGLSAAILRENPRLFMDLALSAAALSPRAAAKKAKAKLLDGWPIEKGGRNIVRTVSSLDMKGPSFLFVNLMEAHDPYIGKKGLDFNWSTPFMKRKPDDNTVRRWRSLYKKATSRALRYGGEIIGNLIGRFGDDQIILLTSDHGQAFNEHGFVGHGTVLFDETIRVPLVAFMPRRFKNKKTKGYQSLVNIRRFMLAAVSGNEGALSMLSSPSVRAESFGIPANVSNVKGIDMSKLSRFDRPSRRSFS